MLGALTVSVAFADRVPAATPTVTLDPSSGPAGSTVTLRGQGLFRGALSVWTRGRRPVRTRASADGRFVASVQLPSRPGVPIRLVTRAGRLRVVNSFRVTGAAPTSESETASATGQRIRWSPSRGRLPLTVVLTGSGFRPRAGLEVAFGGRTWHGRASRAGDFTRRLGAGAGSLGAWAGTVRAGAVLLPFTVSLEQSSAGGPPPVTPAEFERPSAGSPPPVTPAEFERPSASGPPPVTPADDVVAPGLPTVELDPGSDTGRSASDLVTTDATPSLRGTAEPGSTVEVRDGRTLAAAPWPAGLAPASVVGRSVAGTDGRWQATTTQLPDGVVPLRAVAIDAAGNASAPAGLDVTVDTVAPTTTAVGGGPSGWLSHSAATIEFASAENDFECRLNGAAFAACQPAVEVEGLAEGAHSFEARAVDVAGNVGLPVRWDWTVDTASPETVLDVDEAPPALTASSAASFRFDSPLEPGAAFQCSLDDDAFAPCAAPAAYAGLSDGAHRFEVRAVDPVGNADPTPEGWSWTIDTVAPDTTITSAPAAYSRVGSPSFAFAATEVEVRFECRLDGASFSDCASPHALNWLADGPHALVVRAIDRVGNVELSPAAHDWTVDRVPPAVALASPADGTVYTLDATIDVGATASDATAGVVEVRFYDDGNRVRTDTTPPYVHRWDVSNASAGRHSWTAKAFDGAGNSAEAAAVAVDVNLVAATVETAPVPHTGDAADDPAIWVHPSDPAASTVIGTDKKGGLAVYDLAGLQLHYYYGTEPNNVDLRHGVPLDGQASAIVATSDRLDDSLRLYRVDPATRGLVDVAARRIPAGPDVYGVCLYRSMDAVYAFTTYDDGSVRQWALSEAGGRLDAALVREFRVPGPPAADGQTTEACVADDDLGRVYVSAENDAVYRFPADPAAGSAATPVDVTGVGGHLTADVEGLAVYETGSGAGYLIASSQGSSDFAVYDRVTNEYVTRFAIRDGVGAVDKARATDGIDATAANLGPGFQEGMFVAQDGFNALEDGTNTNGQNFKLVPWERIARSMRIQLLTDPTWSPWPAGAG